MRNRSCAPRTMGRIECGVNDLCRVERCMGLSIRVIASWIRSRRGRAFDHPFTSARLRTSTTPMFPSTLMMSPSRIELVAFQVPTTAGIPYSRAAIAAWVNMPPVSVTTPAIFRNSGVQAVLVAGQTRISPDWRVGELLEAQDHAGRSFDHARSSGEPLQPLDHLLLALGVKHLVHDAEDLEGDRIAHRRRDVPDGERSIDLGRRRPVLLPFRDEGGHEGLMVIRADLLVAGQVAEDLDQLAEGQEEDIVGSFEQAEALQPPTAGHQRVVKGGGGARVDVEAMVFLEGVDLLGGRQESLEDQPVFRREPVLDSRDRPRRAAA